MVTDIKLITRNVVETAESPDKPYYKNSAYTFEKPSQNASFLNEIISKIKKFISNYILDGGRAQFAKMCEEIGTSYNHGKQDKRIPDRYEALKSSLYKYEYNQVVNLLNSDKSKGDIVNKINELRPYHWVG